MDKTNIIGIRLPGHGEDMRPGFSLMETVMGMTILAIIAAGVVSGVMLSRRLAESNIHQNTAFTVAQGYLEQIKSMEYVVLTNAVDQYNVRKDSLAGYGVIDGNVATTDGNLLSVMLDTVSIDASKFGTASITNVEIEAPLYLGVWVERNVLIDIYNPGETNERAMLMPMRFRVTIDNLADDPNVGYRAMEITMEYEYQSTMRGNNTWRPSELQGVKSFAPSF